MPRKSKVSTNRIGVLARAINAMDREFKNSDNKQNSLDYVDLTDILFETANSLYLEGASLRAINKELEAADWDNQYLIINKDEKDSDSLMWWSDV